MIIQAGITVSVLLVILLVLKRNKWNADYVLLFWYVANSIHLSLFYLESTPYKTLFAHAGTPLAFVHGPFLFLYVSSFADRLPKRRIWYVIHFLPFLISLVYLTPYLFLPLHEKELLADSMPPYLIYYYRWSFPLLMVQGYAYIFLSALTLYRYHLEIKLQYANPGKVTIRWLYGFVLSMSAIWTIILVGTPELIFTFVAVDTSVRGIVGIVHTSSFTDKVEYHRLPEIPGKKTEKYAKSGLDSLRKKQLLEALNDLMIREKIFKDNDLTLQILAERLSIHPNYLSQILNEMLGVNFYDYLNRYRISEFKNLVKDPFYSRYSLLALAHESGFNSKASFNRNFKKIEGLTPSEYLRKVK